MGTCYVYGLAKLSINPYTALLEIEHPEGLHIGKYTMDKVFLLRLYPDIGINNLGDWIKFLEGKEIITDYGILCKPTNLLRGIKIRSKFITEAHQCEIDYEEWKGIWYKKSYSYFE